MSASIPAPAKAFYIYIDEAGDEGMPSPHTNALLYRDRPSNRSGPSPYFIIGGVLIEDTKRTAALKIMHEIASQLFKDPLNTEIHWRKLDHEKKDYVISRIVDIDFKLIISFACKAGMRNALHPPRLYNYITRLVLERANMQALSGGFYLYPVFSSRAKMSYGYLANYIRYALKTSLINPGPFKALAAAKLRYLQLADICIGAFGNAIEPNRFGRVFPRLFEPLIDKLCTKDGKIWGIGLKAYVGPLSNCGVAERWLSGLAAK